MLTGSDEKREFFARLSGHTFEGHRKGCIVRNSYIDSNGHLRYEPDARHQFLVGIPSEHLDPWMSYDSWDIGLAIRLITIGYNIDIAAFWDESKDWPEGASGKDEARSYINVYERGFAIAKSSIAANLLGNPDSPTNWLVWAKRKGYDVAHLDTTDAKVSKPKIEPTENALPWIAKGLMAKYLGELRKEEATDWAKRLNRKADWLDKKEFKNRGKVGGRESVWQPVLLIDAVIQRKYTVERQAAAAKRARNLFEQKDGLKPWLGAWNQFAEHAYPED